MPGHSAGTINLMIRLRNGISRLIMAESTAIRIILAIRLDLCVSGSRLKTYQVWL